MVRKDEAAGPPSDTEVEQNLPEWIAAASLQVTETTWNVQGMTNNPYGPCLLAELEDALRHLSTAWQFAAYVRDVPATPRPTDGHQVSDRPVEVKAQEPDIASAKPVTETSLYSYYDADDTLLYVGITDNLPGRQWSHIRSSSWMAFAARSTIERFPTRSEAEKAERERIWVQRPLFNSQHNFDPDAPRRLVEYLVRQGRTDLLAPAISRG